MRRDSVKYKDIINFEPLEELIRLTDVNEKEKAVNLIKTYVMSDSMAEILNEVVIPQLQFERFYDNKGIFVVDKYGTGKSHLMKEYELILDLGLLRELGEVCKNTRIRVMAGIQESLFDSPRFTHVKDKIFQIIVWPSPLQNYSGLTFKINNNAFKFSYFQNHDKNVKI
jgi:hypothetical protein